TDTRDDIRTGRQLFRAYRAHAIFSTNWTKEAQFEPESSLSGHNACQAVSTDRARIHFRFLMFVPRLERVRFDQAYRNPSSMI
ncbi:hypothetical protein, partial [Hyphomonas sp.]|uniref:hypothetical protein n=1 Tax=Hyphomonas sp. TaxID=87 RepID=UPI003568C9D9